MFGLANEVVQFLVGQLPGIDSCRHYQRRHHDTSVRVPSPVLLPESFPVDTNFVVFITISAVRSPDLLMYLLHGCVSLHSDCKEFSDMAAAFVHRYRPTAFCSIFVNKHGNC